MFNFKKGVMFIGMAALLLSGCGGTEAKPDEDVREVSSETRRMWQNANPNAEDGTLKESGVVYEDGPIEFCDPVVEEMLRNMIGKPEGEVYISELQEIHIIHIMSGRGYWSNLQSPDGYVPQGADAEGPWEIKQPDSLEDLAYCYNLQRLTLSGIEIPSLKPLRDLPQLESLGFNYVDLGHVELPEEVLADVGELSALKSISFARVKLTTLEPLHNLPQLEALEFQGSVVTEEALADIGGLSALKSLRLGTCDPGVTTTAGYSTYWGDLTDGSFLIPVAAQLTALSAHGGIDWNPEVLAQMTNLEILSIAYADDLSFLEHMPELKKLSMYCCTPEDWSPLALAEKLEYLDIGGNMYTNIEIGLEDLQAIKNLDYLEVSFTDINKDYSREEIIEALPGLTGLVSLFEW